MRDVNVTRKIMSAIKSKNTRPELMLRRALWEKNLRYRIHYGKLPGKPDIVFTKQKVVVFCDGDFWHGHNWAIRNMASLDEELESYSDFWKNKIRRNMERDEENNKMLKSMGWMVVRIWESDIKKNVEDCVTAIEEALFDAMMKQYEDNTFFDR